jgi:hypothetical protein
MMKFGKYLGIASLVYLVICVIWAIIPAGQQGATATETVYRTPSGHACTEKDWDRQHLKERKPGEEDCQISITYDQSALEASRRESRKAAEEHEHYEALKMNCVLLSHTPMSAMSPRDLDDWDFCKQIMLKR